MNSIKRYCNLCFGFLAIILFFSCATPGRPTGGPQDETPPVPLYTQPMNASTNFKATTITVKFDENVKLTDLNKQLTVSPPMARPDIRANNRTLTIGLKDTLRPNSTYVISFGDALADNNEGNILPNYEYVFSTGKTIDMLSVLGEVLDAYTLQPVKDVGITLLSELSDLATKETRPLYIAKTNKDGLFHAKYLHQGCYFLAAIKDGNNDWTYDSLQEETAFLQACVSPKLIEMPVFPDSCSTADSSLIVDSVNNLYRSGYQLLMFKQDLPQSVNKSEFTSGTAVTVEFRNPTKQAEFRILQPDNFNNHYVRWNETKNKAEIFFIEKGITNLLLYVQDGAYSDTLKLLNTKEDVQPFKVSLATGSELAYFDTLKLSFSTPLRKINDSATFWLFGETDTIPLTEYSFNASRTQIVFETPLKQKVSYSLMIPDSLLMDYFDQTNDDTLTLKFRTTFPESYSRLHVKLLNKPKGSCILQVLNEKLEMVQQQILESDSASFTTLKPASYRLRLIQDRNLNGRWDAGNLREQRLPETVFILPKTLPLQADWDYEEEWKL
ncbi:MAG: Ig-like domain-containing protein [Bacteroidales bacterium]|jgi:hypothetical protein|nr:Ig-like domain-containing protein [Bacteroidales bacterium]